MDSDKKKRLEELKRQAQIKKHKHELEKNELLQECLCALKSYSFVDNEDEIQRIIRLASATEAEMHAHNEHISLDDEEQHYIVWDEASLPIVLCSGKTIKEFWDDVLAVAFDTYFVSESTEKVTRVRH